MRRLIFYLFIVFSFFFAKSKAQSPNSIWAYSIGANGDDRGFANIDDDSGNIYSTGDFSSTMDFDPGSNIFNLTNGGAFVSKLNSSGNFIWAKAFIAGSTGFATGLSITLDSHGNIYTTGIFGHTVDFDPGAGVFNLTSNGYDEVFISKLNSNGDFVWAKSIGGPANDENYSVSIDNSDNIYITGRFNGVVDFDPNGGIYNLTSSNDDIFILKLDSSSNFIWAESMGGISSEQGTSIFIDKQNGCVYTTGNFYGTVDFDPGTGIYNLISTGGINIFISKLDSSGHFIWAERIGGAGNAYGNSLAVSPNSKYVYSTGYFYGTADFDPGIGTYNLTSAGGSDIYISKLDSAGNFIWANRIGDINDDGATFITLDLYENVYTTGAFTGTVDFDPGAGIYNLATNPYNDAFISKLDSSENFIWAKSMGGIASLTTGYGLALHGFDDIFLTGSFAGTHSIFDSITLTNADTFNYTWDIFIAKLSQCTANSSATINETACNNYTLPSGNHTWASSGTYTDIIPNAAGCDSVITINLTINTVDTAVIQSGVTLTAAATAASYQWLNCNAGYAAITGAANQTYTATTNGNYAVAITQNGCTDTSGCYSVTGVGISEQLSVNSNQLFVFPNPVSSVASIKYQTTKAGKSTVTVENCLGQTVTSLQITNNQKQTVDMSSYASGMYFIKCFDGKQQTIIKIVKE